MSLPFVTYQCQLSDCEVENRQLLEDLHLGSEYALPMQQWRGALAEDASQFIKDLGRYDNHGRQAISISFNQQMVTGKSPAEAFALLAELVGESEPNVKDGVGMLLLKLCHQGGFYTPFFIDIMPGFLPLYTLVNPEIEVDISVVKATDTSLQLEVTSIQSYINLKNLEGFDAKNLTCFQRGTREVNPIFTLETKINVVHDREDIDCTNTDIRVGSFKIETYNPFVHLFLPQGLSKKLEACGGSALTAAQEKFDRQQDVFLSELKRLFLSVLPETRPQTGFLSSIFFSEISRTESEENAFTQFIHFHDYVYKNKLEYLSLPQLIDSFFLTINNLIAQVAQVGDRSLEARLAYIKKQAAVKFGLKFDDNGLCSDTCLYDENMVCQRKGSSHIIDI